jgi:hypothetical protein
MARMRGVLEALPLLVRPSLPGRTDLLGEVRRVTETLLILVHPTSVRHQELTGFGVRGVTAGAAPVLGALLVQARASLDKGRFFRVIGMLLILSGMAGLLPSSQHGVPMRMTAAPQWPSHQAASENQALDLDPHATASIELEEPASASEPWSGAPSAEVFDGSDSSVAEGSTEERFQAWIADEEQLGSEESEVEMVEAL